MAYIVTAKVSREGKRATSQRYGTKAEAEAYARRTAQDRPGSNPRVKKVK